MKKLQKPAALLLCGLLLLPGCTKTTDDPSKTSEAVEKTQILTNVFKGTRIPLPEEASVTSDVTPYYNKETGETTVLCTAWVDRGNDSYGYNCTLLTFTADGTVTGETTFELEENTYINRGILTPDSLYFIKSTYDEASAKETHHIAVLSFADGTLTLSDDVTGLFAATQDDWFYINHLAIDGDGFLYLGADQEIVVLDQSFLKQFSVTVPNWLNGMSLSPDGTVYAGDGQSFAPIDKSSKALGQPLTLPDTFRAYNVLFGEGYDLFCSLDDGLYGYNFPEAGTPAEDPVLVCSYANSDLIANNLDIGKILSPDQLLLYERDPQTYESSPVVYSRSADVDLSRIQVLEIAYTSADYELSADIVEFNKANTGVRIIPRDYSVYNTEENYEAGETKLTGDILNGLYKPDIVTGYGASDVITQIYENNLYADLYPLMNASGAIARDDLIGCVTRTYESPDGKLWAIGDSFSVQTLMGTKAMLGDRTGWTLAEMIDFAKSLPEGTTLLQGLSQASAPRTLLGQNGYGMFIDPAANTCNFETEDFLAYLDYLTTLPKDYDTAMIDNAAATGISADDYENRYLLYHNGQVALKEAYYYGVNDWVGMEANFNTPDVVHIGYPTADGLSDGSVVSLYPYVITSFCEAPETAWSFLESLLLPDENARYYGHEFPVLKEEFMKVCEEEYDSMFEVYFDGSMSWGSYNPEYDDINAPLDRPGIRKFFSEEDAAAMLNWLDKDVGAPVTSSVNPEISAIIDEEISSYLAGTKTAADCAKIIQSRVTIWLAEHE